MHYRAHFLLIPIPLGNIIDITLVHALHSTLPFNTIPPGNIIDITLVHALHSTLPFNTNTSRKYYRYYISSCITLPINTLFVLQLPIICSSHN